ncbi:MAG: HD domain-containing phosphohydrolase [Gallionella sp.]|jgi:putative two-component system response regulator
MKMTRTVLLVDNNPHDLQSLEILLKTRDYETIPTRLGTEAVMLAKKRQPDIILLDPMLKDMNGFDVVKTLKGDPHTRNIPIIILTSMDDRDSRLRGLVMGAEESLTKPVDRLELSVRVENLIRLKEYGDLLADQNRRLEIRVNERTMQLADSHHETISIMTAAAEHKDEDTGLHVMRISHYCRELSEHMGLDANFSDCIFYASPMHDIGKIGIPDHILLKPDRHTHDEREAMKKHVTLGAKILKKGRSPYMRMGAEIALNHHERWDGGGYPNGRRGEEIPVSARLMTIADQYDALRAKRPYKPALDHYSAMKIITVGDGRTMPGHFDPDVLEAFKACSKTFRGIYDESAGI